MGMTVEEVQDDLPDAFTMKEEEFPSETEDKYKIVPYEGEEKILGLLFLIILKR